MSEPEEPVAGERLYVDGGPYFTVALPIWLVGHVPLNLTAHLEEWHELIDPDAAIQQGLEWYGRDDWIEGGNFVVPRFHTADLLRRAAHNEAIVDQVRKVRLRKGRGDASFVIGFDDIPSLTNATQSIVLGGAILGTATGAGFNGAWLAACIGRAEADRLRLAKEEARRAEEEERRELAREEEEFHRRRRERGQPDR